MKTLFLPLCALLSIFALATASTQGYQELLAQPTQQLLTMGGDDRTVVSKATGVNKYFTNPLQTEFPSRSSCTASFPSRAGFQAAVTMHNALTDAARAGTFDNYFSEQMSATRKKIANYLSVPDDALMITAPSGTTTEILFSFFALLRARRMNKALPVLNIVTAAEETGSGSAAAAAGRHFSTLAPSGEAVTNNEFIPGFTADQVSVIQMPLRDKQTGSIYDPATRELDIEKMLKHAITDNNQVAVLHLMHASKTGLTSPSFAFALRMKKTYGDKVMIIVDAAQNRGHDGFVNRYLDAGMCVFVTGSKLYQGVPFSGLMLIPPSEGTALSSLTAGDVPAGLGMYFTADDIDERLTTLRTLLPTRKNIGSLLGWQTSLANMADYYALPAARRETIIKQWHARIAGLINTTPYLATLAQTTGSTTDPIIDDLIGNCNTIIAVCICPPETTKPLNADELRKVYQYMVQNIANLLPAGASQAEQQLGSEKYLIGQPVKMNDQLGAVRIALGATTICALAESNDELINDERITEKLSLIARYWSQLNK